MRVQKGLEVIRREIEDQLRCEMDADRAYTMDLKEKVAERDALIRMLVRGRMAEERVRMWEKTSESMPF